MIAVTIDDKDAQALLGSLIKRGEDLHEPLRAIGDSILAMTDLAFTTEKSPAGAAWAPLKPVTLEHRRDGAISGASILRDTGILAGSYLIQRLTSSEVLVGTTDKRAGTHQYGARKGQYGTTSRGGPIPWGDIPARPMLPEKSNPQLLSDITSILRRYLSP